MTNRLRVLTWHIHGNYLYYLGHIPHDIYLPTKPGRPEGYGGLCGSLPWQPNLHEVPAESVRNLEFDCILFQSKRNYTVDQFELLSADQLRLPRIYLEHDPPRESPTETRHPVDDPNVLLIHVTHFNDLMWNSGATPTRVIEHGVVVPESVRYTGELARGITVVNGLKKRGRRLGADVFARVREQVPVDLVGMESEQAGGLGEVDHARLGAFCARYRFLFNPIRYTSLGLAVCEAMMLGIPVIGLATTEMATAVENGVSGYVDTNIDRLIARMRLLLGDRSEAMRLSEGAQRIAKDRFGISRFVHDWDDTLQFVTGSRRSRIGPSSFELLEEAGGRS